ncbi:MAG TPA: ABC transporter permease subunit [Flexilinea sp.]|nr:ABC transporter permease subunit [Flexilinea sp.]HPB40490.1 ABC transporter permease subunit [Flexilinea sp.]
MFWLAVWQALSMIPGWNIFLASPIVVFKTAIQLVREPVFWTTVLFSFTRIVAGFIFGLCAGIVFAILSVNFQIIRLLLEPIVLLIKSTPVASFIILVLFFISSSMLSTVIAFLMVFPILYTNTLQGILETDKQLLEMASVFKISKWKKFRYIYVHDVMPFFISGVTVALGICWKSGIAAEVIGLPTGSIGEKLYEAKIFLSSGDLFAWTAVIILISFGFEKFFLWALRKVQVKLESCA